MTESGVRLERVSISYYLPPTGNDYSESNHYPSMFADDVAQDLFPTGGDVDRNAVFQLSPNDEHVSRIIESAFARYGGGGGYGRTLSSILSGFGNQTARSLVSCGSETFEVAPCVDANAQTIGFAVLRMDGARSFAGVTWQTIPRNALAVAYRENPKPVNRRLVWIPQERVVQMRLPREYKRIPSGFGTCQRV